MLKQHIENSGESRSIWAERLGVSTSYLSLLCNHKKQPGLDLAVKIERETGGAVPVATWVNSAPTSTDAPSGSEAAA